jgi:mutator protein MutT
MEPNKKTPLQHSSTPTLQTIEVSAALIFRSGKLLITRRHSNAHLGGLWEFPGGKREPDETFEQCLVREIREELGVEISAGKLFESVTHAYPEKTVRLNFFVCRLERGEPQMLGCAAFKWIRAAELDHYQFPATDTKLLEKIKKSRWLWSGGQSSARRERRKPGNR